MDIQDIKSKMSAIQYKVFNKEKVLVITDIHSPFHREEIILDLIKKHKHEITAIIFGGDIIDCEAISSFPKEIRKPLIKEMGITHTLFNKIDRLTPNIKKYLIWGNHEQRFVKYLADLDSELNSFHSDNILENIINGFTHHDRVNKKKIIYRPLSDNFVLINKWFVQYNDLIIAHPKNYSKVPLKTATNTVEHFLKRGFDFNALFIGHTHKWGCTEHYGKWVGELGCVCDEMEYADTGNTGYTPQHYGYGLFAFDNGLIDINESKLYRIWVDKEGEEEWLIVNADQS